MSNPPQNPIASLLAAFAPGMAALGGPSLAAGSPTQAALQQPAPPAVPSGGAATPPTQAAPVPQGGMGGMNPLIQSLLGQAQQTLGAPMGQPVPQFAGSINALQHPIAQALIKAIAQGAQSYGWTAMMPEERLKRTELQQQKGEALARLAETGAYQEGMLGVRQGQLGVAQENADTRQANERSLEENRQFTQRLNAAKNAWQKTRAEAQTAIGQGHLQLGVQELQKQYAQLHQTASQFEQMFQIRSAQVGIERAKLELGQQANDIRQEAVEVAKTLGTARQETGAGEWDRQHYILSSMFGGISDVLGQALGGMPQALPQTGINPAVQPPAPTAPPANKFEAKRPKAAGSAGPVVVNGFTFPNQQAADAYKREAGIR